MTRRILRRSAVVGVTAAGAALSVAAISAASGPSGPTLTNVSSASARSDGYAPASKLSVELAQIVVAQGSTKAENATALTSTYGYDNDTLTSSGEPQMVPTATNPNTEAHKTEPDKNTYLVFPHSLTGADPNYDYGTHFLFQGHEGGAGGAGYITRINLDADAAHRVTVLATQDSTGANLATIDGSTWDPFAQRLLFTTESSSAPTYAATPGYPSTVTDISGSIGRGGYEGIQNDSAGDVFIVEDAGGTAKPDSSNASTTAKRPNSFLFRYVPARHGDLAHGKLQALQVQNIAGQPITFESQAALEAPDQVQLHSYGLSLKTTWVTVHDTAVDGTAPYNANTAAKAVHATPFKRPENGVFQPGTKFRSFVFTETGDTTATSPENGDAGGFGDVQQLVLDKTGNTGVLHMIYRADEVHAAPDNITFLSADRYSYVQDMGATLHDQGNALDSGFVFDMNANYANSANQPVRWIAEGRDASATLDASNGGFGKNEDDNELTGIYVSNGDIGVGGILGAAKPHLFHDGWRWFYTQQHGDNPTFEVVPASRGDHGSDH